MIRTRSWSGTFPFKDEDSTQEFSPREFSPYLRDKNDEVSLYILCHSVTQPNSFKVAISRWMSILETDTPIILLGTKTDLRTNKFMQQMLAKRFSYPVSRQHGTVLYRDIIEGRTWHHRDIGSRDQNLLEEVAQGSERCHPGDRRGGRISECSRSS